MSQPNISSNEQEPKKPLVFKMRQGFKGYQKSEVTAPSETAPSEPSATTADDIPQPEPETSEVKPPKVEPKPSMAKTEVKKFSEAQVDEIAKNNLYRQVREHGGDPEKILSPWLMNNINSLILASGRSGGLNPIETDSLRKLQRNRERILFHWIADSEKQEKPNKEEKVRQNFANGFENGESENGEKVLPKFSEGQEVIVAKASGSYLLSENSRPANISPNMIGEHFTFRDYDEHSKLAFLEGADYSIYVPLGSLASFLPEKDWHLRYQKAVIENNANGEQVATGARELPNISAAKERETGFEYPSLVLANGIEIAPDQEWSLKTDETAQYTNYDDFLIEKIFAGEGDNVVIKFFDREPEQKSESEWAEIFAGGTLAGRDIELASSSLAAPGETTGVVYENDQIVPERSNIPQVEIPETEITPPEITKADDQVVSEVEQAVPKAAAEDKIETAGEAGELPAENLVSEKLPTNIVKARDEFIAGKSDPNVDQAANLEGIWDPAQE